MQPALFLLGLTAASGSASAPPTAALLIPRLLGGSDEDFLALFAPGASIDDTFDGPSLLLDRPMSPCILPRITLSLGPYLVNRGYYFRGEPRVNFNNSG